MRFDLCAALAAAVCALAGCATIPPPWPADTVPVATAPAVGAPVPRNPCPAIDPAIAREAARMTPIASLREGEALTAALIGSEAAKNYSLARLLHAYEKCRRATPR